MKVNWFIPSAFNHRDYNRMPASIWIRCWQLLPYLREQDVESQVNAYHRRADVAVFVRWQDEEALQVLERQRRLGAKIIFDLCINYFDATGLFEGGYGTTDELRQQALAMAEAADFVTCASTFIAERARAHGFKSRYIPDSVDRRHFACIKPLVDFDRRVLTAIWSGQSTKGGDLLGIAPILNRLEIPLMVVADKPIPGVAGATFAPWTYESFPQAIIQGDVCVTPRRVDNAYDQGHSIFKVGVFMAEGVPALASPIPSYKELLLTDRGGSTCDSTVDWLGTLEMILSERNRLKVWSVEARERMKEYLTRNVANSYPDLFDELRPVTSMTSVKRAPSQSPQKKQVRRVQGKRLVYYAQEADVEFWDLHWEATLTSSRFSWAEQGHLPMVEGPCLAHLLRTGRILEAGCGPGWYVLALRRRGYDAEGVEYAERTVERVKKIYPDLPIRVGDVTNLDVPDGYYSGYISLGVVEHRQEGPEPFLREAYRILRPEGVALISVPYFHILRRLKAALGMFNVDPGELDFYQYAFHPGEFCQLIERAGFQVIATYRYDPVKGIKDEIPLVRKMLTWGKFGQRFRATLERLPFLNRYLGHMLLVVGRKV